MKKAFTVFLVLFSIIGTSQNLNDSLLLFYPMDGNCLDSSVNGFDANIINADLTTDHNGNANKAYHFNGVDQYIDWPASTELQPQLPITMAFWVEFDVAVNTSGVIFDSDLEQNISSGFWAGITESGCFNISYGDASGSIGPSFRRSKTGTTPVQAGVWYFVVGVIRGATDMDLYVNCVNDGGTYSGTGGNIGYTSVSGSLGRLYSNMGAPAFQLNGSLDDFRIWNRALTSSEVEKLCSFDAVLESDLAMFELFPNPTMDYLTLDKVDEDVKQVDIVDIFGNIMMSYSIDMPLNVSGLQPGIFFLRLIDANGKITATSTFVKL